jgi:probable blue pigment (indigoidine) exporter
MTALAPSVWGTTYYVTTEFLPPHRPLLAGVLRALPAGLLLVAATRRLPHGVWWWRSLVLGTLNIGAFFALLFIAAYRLPGGVAATIGALQPLLVVAFSAGLLGDRLTPRTVLAGLTGVLGVSLMVLRSGARLDALGIAAALGSAVVMAVGVVLSKRWPAPAPLLATTGWQLVAGGLVLLPVALLVEGPPPTSLTTANLLGYGYLTLIGAALAYVLWFRGIRELPPTNVTFLGLLSPVMATVIGWLALGQVTNVTFLGLLSPVMATVIGWLALGQGLTLIQALGGALVLGSLAVAQLRPVPAAPQPSHS